MAKAAGDLFAPPSYSSHQEGMPIILMLGPCSGPPWAHWIRNWVQALTLHGKHGSAWHAVVDTTEGPRFAEIQNLALSPDGRHVAYWARIDEQWHVVVDGLASPPFDHPLPESRLVFDSPDLLHGLGVRDLAVVRVEIERVEIEVVSRR